MNVFGVGLPELVLIFVVALLIFGPKKLPEIGRSLGKAIRGFQDASKEFENEFKREAAKMEQAMQGESMEASLESSPPQALSPASDNQAPQTQDSEATASTPDQEAVS